MPTTYNDASTTYNQSNLSYIGEAGSLANLPAIGVYAAFNTTNPYDLLPQWTEITSYVREANVRRGRTDDLQKFPPAIASLVLDNNSRLFDPFDTGLVTERTNLCPAPSGESDPTVWSSAQSGSPLRSLAYALVGSYSFITTMSSTTDSNVFAMPVGTITYATTGAYTASAWFYIPTGSTLAGRTITASFEGGTQTNTGGTSQPATLVANAWVRCSYTGRNFTSTSGTSPALVFRLSGTLSTAVGQAIYMDGCLVEQSATLGTYFDGSTYGTTDPTLTSVWNGTTNNSTSKMMSYRRRTNLMTNPSFETVLTGSSGFNITNSRVLATWGFGQFAQQTVATSTGTSGPFYASIPVDGGVQYAFSAYGRHVSGTARTYRMTIEWYNSAAGLISQVNGTSQAITTSPQRWTFTGTSPAAARTATITIYSTTTGTVGDTAQWDAILFEQSSTVGDYFDGDTYASGSVGVGQSYWTGTLENSTSYLLKYPRAVHLTPRTPIKIEATWDSTTYTVFRGFISGWPVEWTDAGKDSTITIECFDLLGLLSTETIPKDWPFWFTYVEKQLTSNDHYWRFNEGNGAGVVKDWVGGMDLTANIGGFAGPKLGEPCVSESLFFTSISGTKTGVVAAPTNIFGVQGFGFCVNAKGVVGLPYYSIRIRRGYQQIYFIVNADGSLSGEYRDNVPANGFTFSEPAGTVLYDQTNYWHGFVAPNTGFFDFSTFTTYLSVSPTPTLISNSTFNDTFEAVNCFLQECYTSDGDTIPYFRGQGVVSRNAGDFTISRLNRLISTTKISPSLTNIESDYDAIPPSGGTSYSSRLISLQDFSSNPDPITEINRVLDASLGVFFCSKEGILTYFGRDYPFERTRNVTSQVTFTDSGVGIGYDKSSLRVSLDGDLIRNSVSIRYSGNGEYTATNQSSIQKYGAADMSLDTDLSYGPVVPSNEFLDYNTAETQADFLLSIYENPKIKIEPFLVRGQEDPSYNWPRILGLEVLDRVTFVRTPTIGSALNKELLVQSIDHRITPALWETTINGSTRFTNWFIIGKSLIGGEDLLY